jgi:hypothetical protein
MEPAEFESFWRRLLAAQGEVVQEHTGMPTSNVKVRSRTRALLEDGDGSRPNQLRATINKEGLDCVVEGSPRAVADFLQLVSNWESSVKPEGKV